MSILFICIIAAMTRRRFIRILVLQHFDQRGGNHLPRQAEFVFEPTALAFLTAVGQLLPQFIDFCLRFAVHRQRYGFVEFEYRPAVQRDELLALELKRDGQD